MPTVLNTKQEPVLGSIVESSAYTKPIGSTMAVISRNPSHAAPVRSRTGRYRPSNRRR